MSNQNDVKLLDEVRNVMRLKHYSIHTEQRYCDWIKRFVNFHGMTGRVDLLENAEHKIESFLSALAIEKHVSASTQNQAMNALVFLYKRVLDSPLENRIDAIRSTKSRRIPVVLTQAQVKDVITLLDGTPKLLVKLLYGSGLRITEALRLRVQDLDYEYKQVTVRSGKGNKDRVTPFSNSLMPFLTSHLKKVKLIHDKDLEEGFGAVYLPYALSRKYPNAEKEWAWQYVFPARNRSVDPRSKVIRRHHVDPSVINKSIKVAVRKLGITKKVSAHTFRHYADNRIMPSRKLFLI